MKSGLMKKKDDEGAGEIDLTPMLDVVFILLIFFIVTSVFVTESGIDVIKPEASTRRPRWGFNSHRSQFTRGCLDRWGSD